MHITGIKIQNFRNIEASALSAIESTVALFGLNGQAKSSVLNALQMVLLGWCPHTTRGGAGAAKLIRDGAKETNIEVSIESPEGQIIVWLTIKRKGSDWAAMWEETGEVIDDVKNRSDLYRLLRIPERHMAVCAVPDLFITSSELGDILSDFLSGNVTAEAIQEFAGEHREWLAEFAKRKRLTMDDAHDFKSIGVVAEDVRRDHNRELKEEELLAEPGQFRKPPKDKNGKRFTAEDLPRVEAVIERDKARRDALLVEKGKAETAPGDEDRKKIESVLLEAAKEEDRIISDLDRVQAEIQEAETSFGDAKKAEGDAVLESHSAMNALSTAEKQLKSLNEMDEACPTCTQKISKALRKKLVGPVQAEVSDLDDRAREAKNKHITSTANLAERRAAVTKLREQYGDIRHEHKQLTDKMERDKATLEQMQTSRPLSEVESDIADLEAKLERGAKLVKDLEALCEKEGSEVRIDKLKQEILHLDWAVRAFRDGEAIKALSQDEMVNFTHRCNLELSPFGEYELDVKVAGKKVELLLQCPGQESRPVSQCSHGQQKLAEFAVALAFADTGAPVFLDNLNELDHEHRKTLLGRIRGMNQNSIIIASTWQQSKSDMKRIAESLDPVTVVWVNDGDLEVVLGAHEPAEV